MRKNKELIMIFFLSLGLILFAILSLTVLNGTIASVLFLVAVSIALVIAHIDLFYDYKETNEMISEIEKNLEQGRENISQMKKEYHESVCRDDKKSDIHIGG